MKVVFHVGQAKTGTTAIQKSMSANRQAPLDQGILYPEIVSKGMNHKILIMLVLKRVQRSMTPILGRILDLVDKYFGKVSDLSFLVYLRQPSEHYASLLQQKLKESHLHPKNNSGKILHQIEKFSAMGDVIVRQFSREMLVDNDIVKDACAAVGIDPHQFRALAKEPNSSISAEGAMLLQEYRRRHHLQKDNIFTKDTNAFIQKIRQVENNHPDVFTKIKVRRGLAQVLDRERPDTEKNFRTLWCRLKPKLRGVISRRAGFDGCCRCG